MIIVLGRDTRSTIRWVQTLTISTLFSSRWALAIIYLILVFPVVLVQVYATPPFQMPDEPHHFMRALQIADGHWIARRLDANRAGGDLESAAQVVAMAFRFLKNDFSLHYDPHTFQDIVFTNLGLNGQNACRVFQYCDLPSLPISHL